MDELKQKHKQREALENAYTNFVEPHINQQITVQIDSVQEMPIAATEFGCVSGWLLFTVVYCLWVRWR